MRCENNNDSLKRISIENKNSDQFKSGYTLMELLVVLSILSLLTVAMVTIGFGEENKVTEKTFNDECEKILYTLLQYQNEAIMDGYRRQVRFQENGMQIIWTRDKVTHRVFVPVDTFSFSGSYTGDTPLNLYGHGTVSQGGTVTLTGPLGSVRKLIVQVGNGRIYLDEP